MEEKFKLIREYHSIDFWYDGIAYTYNASSDQLQIFKYNEGHKSIIYSTSPDIITDEGEKIFKLLKKMLILYFLLNLT